MSRRAAPFDSASRSAKRTFHFVSRDRSVCLVAIAVLIQTAVTFGSGMLDVYWNGRYVMGMTTSPAPPPSLAPGDLAWSTDALASALATGTTSTIGFVGAGACGASLNDVILQPAPVPVG